MFCGFNSVNGSAVVLPLAHLRQGEDYIFGWKLPCASPLEYAQVIEYAAKAPYFVALALVALILPLAFLQARAVHVATLGANPIFRALGPRSGLVGEVHVGECSTFCHHSGGDA